MFSYDKLQEIKFDKILAGGNREIAIEGRWHRGIRWGPNNDGGGLEVDRRNLLLGGSWEEN